MANQPDQARDPADLDNALERMIDRADPEELDALDPLDDLADASSFADPSAVAEDARAEAGATMAEIARELQERLRAEQEALEGNGPGKTEPAAPPRPAPTRKAVEATPTAVRAEARIKDEPASAAQAPAPKQADPPAKPAPKAKSFDPEAEAASLDDELVSNALDVTSEFDDVDSAIGAIFDTRASAVQRGNDPAEVRDFLSDKAEQRTGKPSNVRYGPPPGAPEDDIDADLAEAQQRPAPSALRETKQDAAPAAPAFDLEETVATPAPAPIASDEDRFSAFEAMPLHEAEIVPPGPLLRVLIAINKPLASASKVSRTTVGLAAVMTLFNAACLWAWLILR